MLVPERISPPEASGAPERRLPVCELWNVTLHRLVVVDAADEEHAFAEVVERLEHLAEFHLFAFALRPPFLAVETRYRKRAPRAARVRRSISAGRRLVAPDAERFQPG
jgi:hypothetical protein